MSWENIDTTNWLSAVRMGLVTGYVVGSLILGILLDSCESQV